MKPIRHIAFLLLGAAGPALAQQSQGETITVPLTDPGRAAVVRVQLMSGNITVRAANRRDVLVVGRARDEARREDPAASGLRRLTQTAGFSVEEERNEITVEGGSSNRAVDFEIQVPTRTNLKLTTINRGQVVVEGVEGEIEVENTNGPITLTRIAGSAVANSVNGKVLASLTRVTPDKAMAFTSYNGTVDVTFPASLKANLKLRSDRGDVFSDFDVQIRPSAPVVQETHRASGRFQVEVNNSIFGTVGGGGPEIELRTWNGPVFFRKGQ
jgi:DUF4097 and DUF4098 domain-containing protein YvlB